MPWRGPEHPGEFPTLGYVVGQFIESTCAIPDGDRAGEPFVLTDEQLMFLLWFYRIDPESGRLHYARGGQLVRPQKWGKGPLSAAIICAEAEGPVLPDGWDADGEPVGRPWATPWIQVTAASEDQTANIWRALVPMIELGELAHRVHDVGDTRIKLPGGGRIEPVTFSAISRLGQRTTFVVQDEPHAWTRENGGIRLADNQRRNLAGMGGRFLETTNAWDPADQSVAQQTFESAAPGVYKDNVEPGSGSIRNKRERRRMLRRVYGDSHWVDLDRIEGEIDALLEHDPPQAERFFLNRSRSAEDAAFDPSTWTERAVDRVVPDRAVIVIGVDGARWDDALALVATDVESGHQWPLEIWERPANAPDEYEHPLDEVDGVMSEAFDRYDVWRAYCDPQFIEKLVDRWRGRWGEKRVVEWLTNRPRQIAYAVRNYVSAVSAGDLTHDGDTTMARHIGNARRRKLRVYDEEHRQMYTLSKDYPMSPRKIDAAMAGVLAWEARGDAIAAGATKRRGRKVAFV